MKSIFAQSRHVAALFGVAIALVGCSSVNYPPAPTSASAQDYTYIIGPGDSLNIVVWRNPELTTTVPVRPDGKIATSLVDELSVQGKTSVEVARDVEKVLPFKLKMSLLDVMIAVGGLTDFAAGNRATILRGSDGNKQYSVRLQDLIKRGDMSANVEMRPGDILIIPQSYF
ncbi:MAG: polysaccharide biosynthesis/export family protein [Ideonella sp.]|nr:polysaccharide biosynthesis/export family protein [Ideonella sp.]